MQVGVLAPTLNPASQWRRGVKPASVETEVVTVIALSSSHVYQGAAPDGVIHGGAWCRWGACFAEPFIAPRGAGTLAGPAGRPPSSLSPGVRWGVSRRGWGRERSRDMPILAIYPLTRGL